MTIQAIENNHIYQRVLRDSMGGVMYNSKNIGKYPADEILHLWDCLTDAQRETADGIMKGVIDFLKTGRD